MPVGAYSTDDILERPISLDEVREARQRYKKATQDFMKKNQKKRGGRKRK